MTKNVDVKNIMHIFVWRQQKAKRWNTLSVIYVCVCEMVSYIINIFSVDSKWHICSSTKWMQMEWQRKYIYSWKFKQITLCFFEVYSIHLHSTTLWPIMFLCLLLYKCIKFHWMEELVYSSVNLFAFWDKLMKIQHESNLIIFNTSKITEMHSYWIE